MHLKKTCFLLPSHHIFDKYLRSLKTKFTEKDQLYFLNCFLPPCSFSLTNYTCIGPMQFYSWVIIALSPNFCASFSISMAMCSVYQPVSLIHWLAVILTQWVFIPAINHSFPCRKLKLGIIFYIFMSFWLCYLLFSYICKIKF
jgi:hypothetical protein